MLLQFLFLHPYPNPCLSVPLMELSIVALFCLLPRQQQLKAMISAGLRQFLRRMSAAEGTPLLQTSRGWGFLCCLLSALPHSLLGAPASLSPLILAPSQLSSLHGLLSFSFYLVSSWLLFSVWEVWCWAHVLIRPLTGKTVCNTQIC